MKSFSEAYNAIKKRGSRANEIMSDELLAASFTLYKTTKGKIELEHLIAAMGIGVEIGQEMMKEDNGKTTARS